MLKLYKGFLIAFVSIVSVLSLDVGVALAGTPTIYRYFPSTSSYSIQVGNSINFSVGCDDSEGLSRVDWYVNGNFDHSTSISGYYDEAIWNNYFSVADTYNIGAVAVDNDNNTDEIAWLITVTSPPPGSFSLSSPSNGDSYTYPSKPSQLDWTNSSYAASYDVYLERGDSTPDVKVATTTSSSWTLSGTLDVGTWYWKVIVG